eukprot:evm.model.scf_672.2 EVM.evm.TU.scf_672.2   scf_672:8124-11403(-)
MASRDTGGGSHSSRKRNTGIESTNRETESSPGVCAVEDGEGAGPGESDEDARRRIMAFAATANSQRPAMWAFGARGRAESGDQEQHRGSAHGVVSQQQWRSDGEAGGQHAGEENELRLLTYNIWFRDIALAERMRGVGNIIQEHNFPHFICFQEVTRQILHIVKKAAWWSRYVSSEPPKQRYFTLLLCRKDVPSQRMCFTNEEFPSSAMGRGILSTRVTYQSCALAVATSHLESPCNGQTHHDERVSQMQTALESLDAMPSANVLFAGDMNWLDTDGPDGPELPDGWVDAWTTLYPGEEGSTYDPSRNTMLQAPSRYKARLDRVFCKLRDWQLKGMHMVGQEPILNRASSRKHGKRFEVYPSDHFGLLVRMTRKFNPGQAGGQATGKGPAQTMLT